MVISVVTPPMLTVDRLPAQLHWIDPLVQTSVVRGNDATVLASIDLPLLSRPGRSFAIGAGSVWFASGAVNAMASGGFAGLRVKRGVLTVDMDVTFTAFKAHLPVGATATLELQLEQPANVSVQFPNSISIVFAPDKVSLSASGAASVAAFGTRIGLTLAAGAVDFDSASRDLTVPFTPDTATFTPLASDITVSAIEGTAPINAAVWAIPVAFAAVSNLGQAAGVGALRLLLGEGIGITIPSLHLKTLVRGLAISVGTGLVQMTAELAERLTSKVQLWNDQDSGALGPRTSSILFAASPGDRVLVRTDGSTELVSILGACSVSIDRPLTSAGTRLGLSFPMTLLAVTRTTGGITGYVIANQTAAENYERQSLVLENALLIVDAPEGLIAAGSIADARLLSGSLRLTLPLLDVVATLPDPYAASSSEQRRVSDQIVDVLTVAVNWSAEGQATLEVTSKGVGPTPAVVASGRQPDSLLDVSTNADLFGVRMIEGGGARVDTSVLTARGASLALFTVPGVSWEPVEFNDPTITIDPPPNDGDLTVITVESVRLVPVAPRPLLGAFVDMTKTGAPAAMRFMLPFGLVADASLPLNSIRNQGASFELVMPTFDQDLTGGHQLTLRPPNPQSPIAGFPGSVSPAGPGGKQVLGASVFSIFDSQFGPSAKRPMVPVRRVDVSGYGNSMFSDWLDTTANAGVPAVAEARFDVVVGRTSYEVIQVVSVIYPWGIRAFERLRWRARTAAAS
jgi:hypothetical protein